MYKITLTALLLSVCMQIGFGQSRSRTDWNFNPEWKNTTQYSKVYVVNQKHPKASDNNAGTEDAPFKTINKAAQVVKAGEKVLIHAGVYKETVKPLHGGSSESKMIAYEAANDGEVIIKGSKVINQPWIQRSIYTDAARDTSRSYTWSRKTWMVTLDDSFFSDDYFPLKLMNIEPDEYPMMPWAEGVKEITPYNITRALVFQNGKRMTQLAAYGDLARVPGSFWVDKDQKTVHIHGFDGGNPNSSLVEVGIAEHLFIPQRIGLNYIQLKGLTFEHCANGFLRTSTGAVTALGGHHWIFENNIFRQMNSSALEFGYYAFEEIDTHPLNVKSPRRKPDAVGGMIVRNNMISDCGTAGMRSYVVHDALIEGNHIYNCGWQDAENYWEVAGIKILNVTNSLIRRNYIHNITGGNAIWLDWDNNGSRVSQNIIHDISTVQGSIFVEASQYPNMIDNNFIWNVDGNGVYVNDSDSVKVYHNLIANFSGNAVHGVAPTNRSLNGKKLVSENHHVANNIFINGRASHISKSSIQENNLYVNSTQPNLFSTEALHEAGERISSSQQFGYGSFVCEGLYFNWTFTEKIPLVPRLKGVDFDLKNNLKSKALTFPGPFNNLTEEYSTLLNEQ
ncbi:MAG: right-handed parallel beta-helix repeat-containing protein [Cytophagales bacterium]|nr:right-handed parallel beta-helix repeat-containing protein [Cytophagales bacterium]